MIDKFWFNSKSSSGFLEVATWKKNGLILVDMFQLRHVMLQNNSIAWHDAISTYQAVLIRGFLFFFHITTCTSPDEEFYLNKNLSIIIISHTEIILIKYFCIQKKIKVETRWQINKLSNISFFRFTFFTYIYIYICVCVCVYILAAFLR